MEISATYKGEAVTIVDVDVNGSTGYVTFKDSGGTLIIDRFAMPTNTSATSAAIATGAVGA
jgi:hypothetical protein